MNRAGRTPSFLCRLCVAGLWLAAGLADAATNAAGLVEIDSAAAGNANFRMRIVELERGPKTSLLKLTYEKMGSSVGSSMFIMSAFYEIAQIRGTAYFANLKEWEDGTGARFYVGGFTDNATADLADEFGAEFAAENEFGQPRRLVGVSEVRILFERNILPAPCRGPAAAPPVPAESPPP